MSVGPSPVNPIRKGEEAMRMLFLGFMLLLVLALAGCGGEAAPASGGGDAAAGEKVYNEVAAPTCGSCHSLEPGVNLVGPSLAGIGAEAASRQSGVSAEDYLLKSLTQPDAFVVSGYTAGLMPGTYGTQLSAEQLDDLVAYLLSLK